MFQEIVRQFASNNPQAFFYVAGLIELIGGIVIGMLIMKIIYSNGNKRKDKKNN